MDKAHSLPRHERLANRGRIRRLFESGQSGFIYPLRYMWFAQEAQQCESMRCEVLFTVPKRFHKRANKRNVLRRRIKESYRLNKCMLLDKEGAPKCIDLAMVYSTKEQHSYKTIDNAVRKILENIANAI